MGERWRVCGRWRGTEGVGVGSEYCEKKKIQICPIGVTVCHTQTLPLQQEGEGRESGGVWSLFPLPKPGTGGA